MSDNALEQRRVDNLGQQVDNARLPAGSDMYYYCRSCGAPTAVLPEGWWKEKPPKYCNECEALPEDERTDYDVWLREHDHAPVPR